MALQALIDKQDNFEIIRDQLAALLVAEVANQKLFAVAATKNPDDWDMKIYIERSNPWEKWLNNQDDLIPIINVSFERSSVDGQASDPMKKQKTDGIYNVDCYVVAISSDEPLSGYLAGDEQAARAAHKAARLVRNILMAGENTFLKMRGVVGSRKIVSIDAFRPTHKNMVMQQLFAMRVQFKIGFNEFVDQYVGQNLEYIAIDVVALDDGQLLLEADYQFPLP